MPRPWVDPELLAVLRLLQAAFGDVEILEVVDDSPGATLSATQGWLFDEVLDEDGPELEEAPEAGPGR